MIRVMMTEMKKWLKVKIDGITLWMSLEELKEFNGGYTILASRMGYGVITSVVGSNFMHDGWTVYDTQQQAQIMYALHVNIAQHFMKEQTI